VAGRVLRPFPLVALGAIVVPAAIVAVLGYLSLRQWERSAELLFREQARDMAAMAAEKIEMALAQFEDEFLARLQASVAGPGPIDQAVDALLAREPLIGPFSLFDRAGGRLYATRKGDAEVFAHLPGEVSPGLWERGGRRHLVAGDLTIVTAILTSSRGPLLAAFSPDLESLRREIFAKMLGSLEGSSIVAILDHRQRPVYSRQPLVGGDPIATVGFREGLPQWRLALFAPPGQSPRQAVRRQVAIFTGAFALLLVVIAGGIVLMYRLVRRETEVARLKSDFVANVSHDLKTPLSVIRMFAETLELGRVTDEPRRREYYQVITRESERLSRLIENVLDFSRIEGGRRTYDMAPTAVEPLVRETVEAFAYPLAQGGFKVEIDVAPDLPDVPMDRAAIGQALANLVDNAIKYSGERKSLRVEAGALESGLALSVTDEGMGIPQEEQAKIFEKFYRVGRSETQGCRGSGVGLALVRHVAAAHGGRVTVESRPGAGSRFTLWVPLRAGGGRRARDA
jgi:signal transduction histidine kinase